MQRNLRGTSRSATDVPADLFARTAELAAQWLRSLDRRPVAASADLDELRYRLGGPLPVGPADPLMVVEDLARAAEPGLVAIPSGRYFGFVIGGGLPAAVAADWLTSVWDQCPGFYACGPAASVVEEVTGGWLAALLGLPVDASFAFVTGCQTAHLTCLATARHHVLRAVDWNVEELGLSGAPSIRVVVGARRHVSVDRALRFLGIGRVSLRVLPVDGSGRMEVSRLRDELATAGPPTIVCAQAGEVNTGAFDDLDDIADAVAGTGAWLHVDGAYGLWTAASPALRHLVRGVERADSWAFDAHKWLNVPYDSGLAFCAHPDSHRAAMTATAEYLVQGGPGQPRDAMDWTPAFSRRARGFAVYAALRSLGREGVAELLERSCAHARRFAAGLATVPGCEVLNEVVINQVLFRFDDDRSTDAVLRRVIDSGEAWLSGTTLDGRRAIRLSVTNWQTSDSDITRALDAFRTAAAELLGRGPSSTENDRKGPFLT
ncbi:pyridoxal phosphate-dependent decarboxylase family protein [Plantactinospora soyae]|uniref:Glutamate/tyrosine decarboxylase-like PLP-dependent enzyme n=1 Tax=Plantactinospora soyae TaxID=1544732 RepID=A0A927MBM3_9ACTN|nr:pyridoxal-dependent decarboxylase [Plantactinospora soyae]MBE1491479.1 glutamate/tyrosine decarboxylase-like PLP-dependent enzyme [Plantactinospora soyae]